MPQSFIGQEIRSTIDTAGVLTVELAEAALSDPGPEHVIVRVEATPINPGDLALLLGPADLQSLEAAGSADRPVLRARVPTAAMGLVKARVGMPMVPGNEGAGTVVAAGEKAAHLLGKRVGMWGGNMYAQYRAIHQAECVVLPDHATCADGAAMFINPLTALCFVETMKRENHAAILHFAAASNLGQMLNRVCLKDQVSLVNVVRRPEQATLLAGSGARHVLDSSAAGFATNLADALHQTGATLAFDPIGGGNQASVALAAMEAAAARKGATNSLYGSDVFKQFYIYGTLNFAPTVLDRWVGFAWSVGGWLLRYRLRQIGRDGVARLQARVVDELRTTFASHYAATLSLRETLDPDHVRSYARRATDGKYLIQPN